MEIWPVTVHCMLEAAYRKGDCHIRAEHNNNSWGTQGFPVLPTFPLPRTFHPFLGLHGLLQDAKLSAQDSTEHSHPDPPQSTCYSLCSQRSAFTQSSRILELSKTLTIIHHSATVSFLPYSRNPVSQSLWSIYYIVKV